MLLWKRQISQIKSLYMEASKRRLWVTRILQIVTILNGKGYKYESEFNGQKIKFNVILIKGEWMINSHLAGNYWVQPYRTISTKLQKIRYMCEEGLVNSCCERSQSRTTWYGKKAEILLPIKSDRRMQTVVTYYILTRLPLCFQNYQNSKYDK